jgi:DNA-binding SARP family transcriptional activator
MRCPECGCSKLKRQTELHTQSLTTHRLLAQFTDQSFGDHLDVLATLLWGELADADAKNNLRQVLTNLRKGVDDHIESAGQSLAIDPWREEAHRQLMLALARSGQRSAALAQYILRRSTY